MYFVNKKFIYRGIMEWNNQKFINRCHKLMKLNGIKAQTEFNTKIGIRDALTKWRYQTPKIDSCLKICDIFNCSMDWLLGLKKESDVIQELKIKIEKLDREKDALHNLMSNMKDRNT